MATCITGRVLQCRPYELKGRTSILSQLNNFDFLHRWCIGPVSAVQPRISA